MNTLTFVNKRLKYEFKFPYARIAVSVDAFDEETYSLVCLPVPFRPGFQLLPCKIRPELSHGSSS
jgi:hypothetical protein